MLYSSVFIDFKKKAHAVPNKYEETARASLPCVGAHLRYPIHITLIIKPI